MTNYNQALLETKEGFVNLKKPIDEATLALNDYTDAANRYLEVQNIQKYYEYQKKKGGFAGFAATVQESLYHMQFAPSELQQRPKPSEYPNLNPESAAKVDSTMNVYVNTSVDKNGNSTTTVTNNANIPINVRQTGTPR